MTAWRAHSQMPRVNGYSTGPPGRADASIASTSNPWMMMHIAALFRGNSNFILCLLLFLSDFAKSGVSGGCAMRCTDGGKPCVTLTISNSTLHGTQDLRGRKEICQCAQRSHTFFPTSCLWFGAFPQFEGENPGDNVVHFFHSQIHNTYTEGHKVRPPPTPATPTQALRTHPSFVRAVCSTLLTLHSYSFTILYTSTADAPLRQWAPKT